MDSEQETQAPAASEGEQPSNDSDSSAETAPDYNDLTVDELKKKLKNLNLPVSGKKSELVERLVASDQKTDDDSLDESNSSPKIKNIEDLSRSELIDLRKQYYSLAEEIRVKRDELNLKSQTHAAERNDLNQQAKEHMDNVHIHRDRRNGLNVEVGQIRDDRRDLTISVKNLKDRFLKLKRRRFSGTNLPPVSRLRKQLQELEIRQMTTPLTTDKERALVEEIAMLQSKIKQHDELIETDDTVLQARNEFREAEQKRRGMSKEMQKVRQEAQASHHKMKDSLKLNRSIRRKADSAQRLFVKAKEKADEVHNEYIEYLRAIQDIDRITASHSKSGTVADQKASAASAEDLFAKFLAGEKLSTEQLMIIQKAGML